MSIKKIKNNRYLTFTSFISDARHFQISYLASFLLIGIILLGWFTEIKTFAAIILTALTVQFIGSFLTNFDKDFWKSALITSLGLCLLCKTNEIETAIFASALAISSKFLIRYNNKHIFNPVNIGIVLTIVLTNDAWVSPGQWGSHLFILFTLGILGFLVLKRVNRLDASLTFLIVFGGLQFYQSVVFLGWSLDVFVHQMASGTLVLFTFFMITDPMTTPNNRTARIIWVSLIAVCSYLVSNYMHVYAAPIWVLFFASSLVPFFDKIWQSEKFNWQVSNNILQLQKK